MGIVAVTGANGFIGSRVVRALLAKGRKVRALVEPNSDLGNLADLSSQDLDVATCDVLDAASLRKTLSGARRSITWPPCTKFGCKIRPLSTR